MGDHLATIDIGRKLGAVPLLGGGLGPYVTQYTKWHLDPSSHLGTIDMGRKLGVCPLFVEGELGPHLTQCGQGRGLPVCHV